MFQPIEYATDPDLAGICILFEDEVLLDMEVLGNNDWYLVTRYYGDWNCICPGWYFRETCNHYQRVLRFLEKRGDVL